MTTRRTPEVRPDVPDDALSCRKRLYAFRIDGGSGPEQPGAVRKDLRGPAYRYHTPTPVRVTEALQAAGCGGCGTTREGKGGTSTGLGPQVQVQASSQPPGRSSGRLSWRMGRLRARTCTVVQERGKRVKSETFTLLLKPRPRAPTQEHRLLGARQRSLLGTIKRKYLAV